MSLGSEELQLHAPGSHLSIHSPETLQIQPGIVGEQPRTAALPGMSLKTLPEVCLLQFCGRLLFPCLVTKNYAH